MAIIERIMTADARNIQTGQTIVSTLTVSEPGLLATSRLVAGTCYGDSVTAGPPVFTDYEMSTTYTGLLWNGAQQLIRGRAAAGAAAVNAPSAAFSARRNGPFVPLGDYSAQASDTLALTTNLNGATMVGGVNNVTSFAAPFIPQNRRQGFTGVIPQAVAYLASTTVNTGIGGGGQLLLTADSDMIVDLSSLVINVQPQVTGAGAPANMASFDASIGALITQIALPTGENLVLGQPNGGLGIGVPGNAFSALREGNWFSLGYLAMQGGSAITVSYQSILPAQATFSAGIVCHPRNGEGC